MDRTILAVPGLASTSPSFRGALWDMAARHGWNVDAIAAVISNESRFNPAAKNPAPGQTASGLIQFIDSTARSLLGELGIQPLPGAGGAAAKVRQLSAEEQLPLVELYYKRHRLTSSSRPVDFYLAGWGSGVGKPMDHVLARVSDPLTYANGTENLYTLNQGLDVNGDGQITVADVAAKVAQMMAAAGNKRIEAPASSAIGLTLLAAAAPALLALAIAGATLQLGKAKAKA